MPVMNVGTGRALFRENERYLLLDRFLTDQAAPLGATRVCEPGPGSLSVVDASNVMSVSGGVLRVNGTPGANSSLSSALFPRKCGRAFMVAVPNKTTLGITARICWDISPVDSATTIGISFGTTLLRWLTGTTTIRSISLGNVPLRFLSIMRNTGGYHIYSTTSGIYQLGWIYPNGTSDLYAKMSLPSGGTFDFQSDDWMVRDFIGSVWGTDYGLAQALGTYSAVTINNQTFTHPTAATFIEHTITAQSDVTQELIFRQSNATNAWILRMNQAAGTMALVELNGGVETTRNSVAQVWTPGIDYRILVLLGGSSILTYVDNTPGASFSSSFNSSTATGGSISHAGTNLATYPQDVSAAIPAWVSTW